MIKRFWQSIVVRFIQTQGLAKLAQYSNINIYDKMNVLAEQIRSVVMKVKKRRGVLAYGR